MKSEVKPGGSTSEFKMIGLAMAVLTALVATFESLIADGVVDSGARWVVIGLGLANAAIVGIYTYCRSWVKAATASSQDGSSAPDEDETAS